MATYRTEEIPDYHPLTAALPLLSRERGPRLLELRGLRVGEDGYPSSVGSGPTTDSIRAWTAFSNSGRSWSTVACRIE